MGPFGGFWGLGGLGGVFRGRVFFWGLQVWAGGLWGLLSSSWDLVLSLNSRFINVQSKSGVVGCGRVSGLGFSV